MAEPEMRRRGSQRRDERVLEVAGLLAVDAAPVVAQIAKEMGILTVAVVTKPFPFEGRKRAAIADQGIKDLAQFVDSLITIPNEKLLSVLGRDARGRGRKH